jgi:hypothetical protein
MEPRHLAAAPCTPGTVANETRPLSLSPGRHTFHTSDYSTLRMRHEARYLDKVPHVCAAKTTVQDTLKYLIRLGTYRGKGECTTSRPVSTVPPSSATHRAREGTLHPSSLHIPMFRRLNRSDYLGLMRAPKPRPMGVKSCTWPTPWLPRA